MKMLFCELPIGSRFEFRGRRYEKLALSLACDEERCGNIFQDQTEVLSDATPLPASRPAGRPWTERLCLAPGQR